MTTNKRFRVLCGAVFSAAMLLSLAPASFADSPSESRLAREHHACAVIMGLNPADASFDACVKGLDSNFPPSGQANPAQAPNQVGQAPSSAVR